jgi:quinol-cytochrome oxidoreductase complex cytochrome b subunit
VNESTLKRFFSLHFILGFIIGALVFAHLIILHDKGSSSSGNENINNKANFLSLYGEEIIFFVYIFLTFLLLVTCFRPNFCMHPANYEQANPLSTPPHIVPE